MTIFSRIIGTGSYLPEKVLTNRDLESIVDTSDEWIRTRTGIQERRFALEGVYSSDLGLEASRRDRARAAGYPDRAPAAPRPPPTIAGRSPRGR